jgi:hypothetical protein
MAVVLTVLNSTDFQVPSRTVEKLSHQVQMYLYICCIYFSIADASDPDGSCSDFKALDRERQEEEEGGLLRFESRAT